MNDRKRWLALIVLCFGELMIALDMTVVNVALPSIKSDLAFTQTSLVWVINAYILTYGGFLLLGGRLGDFYGNRRMFLFGIALFTLSSLVCGMAGSQWLLIAARAAQGLGGAVVSAVALALIMNLFTGADERAKAMGVYGFVMSGGGSVGVLLGGLLTGAFNWHWIFLINIPLGFAVYAFCLLLLPDDRGGSKERLDVTGAVTVTVALLLAVYAIVNGNETGWFSTETVVLLGSATALLALFLVIEAATESPLMPLGLFRLRNVAVANAVSVLWAASMFAWFFIAALYLQQVLEYTPMQVGLAFLPSNLIMGAFSLGLSAKMVMRFGIRGPLALGLLLAAAGLGVFGFAPQQDGFLSHVLPGMLLLGLGGGMAFNPVLLAAMSDVAPSQSGLASGVVNTSFMMGGSLGLAILASIAAAHSDSLLAAGVATSGALHGGYRIAFILAAAIAAAAALLSMVLLRPGQPSSAREAVAVSH